MKNNRTFLEKLLDGAEVAWKPLGIVSDIKTGQLVSQLVSQLVKILLHKTQVYTLLLTVDVNPQDLLMNGTLKMILLALQQEGLALVQLLGKKVNISEEILIIL